MRKRLGLNLTAALLASAGVTHAAGPKPAQPRPATGRAKSVVARVAVNIASPSQVTISLSGSTGDPTRYAQLPSLNIPPGQTDTVAASSATRTVVICVPNSRTVIAGSLQGPTGCNLYLLSPRGITVGPHGAISSGGSVVVSTADMLTMSDGKTWMVSSATPPVGTLSIASLTVDRQAGNVELDQANIDTPLNRSPATPYTLAIVSNGIKLTDGSALHAFGSRLDLVSLTHGTVQLDPQAPLDSKSDPQVIGRRADISLSDISIAWASAYGDGINTGGRIVVFARDISLLNQSRFTAAAEQDATKSPGTIRIDGTGLLQVTDGSTINASSAGAADNRGEPTNQIQILTGSLMVNGAAYSGETGILAGNSSGPAENVQIDARTGSVVFKNGGLVRTSSDRTGTAGSIGVTAPDGAVVIDGAKPDTPGNITGLYAVGQSDSGAANGGVISINSRDLKVIQSGQIVTSARNGGTAGQVKVNATGNISINGTGDTPANPARILDDSTGPSASNTSKVILKFGTQLKVLNGAVVSSGDGGHILLNGRSGLLRINDATVEADGSTPAVKVYAGIFVPGSLAIVDKAPRSPVDVDTILFFPTGDQPVEASRLNLAVESTDAGRIIPQAQPTTRPGTAYESKTTVDSPRDGVNVPADWISD